MWYLRNITDKKETDTMAIGFESDIKPLFTQLDRDHMLGSFDLWKYDDVKTHATAIYASVEAGRMPPPSVEPRWSAEKLATFHQWMEDGYLP
jgi:hypothetical protein